MELREFFKENPKCAIAFSGGVDSSYLLYATAKYALRAKAYFVKGAFQPEFEKEDAIRLVKDIGADMEIIEADVLSNKEVCKNPPDRCYFCKQTVCGLILEHAKADGFSVILDGTNASDDAADRPGMKALAEMKVLSPLRLCGLTKDEIRNLSKEAGLFTWDKPSYACLATRIRTGEEITLKKLKRTERCEGFMMDLGFSDFRIRTGGDNAVIQLKEAQLGLLTEHRKEIYERLSGEYTDVFLDLKPR